MDFASLDLGQLFELYRRVILEEFSAELGPAQHAAVYAETTVYNEIHKHDGFEPHYRALLAEDHPAFRLRGALWLKQVDPTQALRVFTELYSTNAGAARGIPTRALREILALRRKGVAS